MSVGESYWHGTMNSAGARSCGECVRGLLCATCNKRLGHVEKDVDWLERAFDYAGIKFRTHERVTL